MKVLIINEVFGTTSTGKICAQIAEQYMAEGHEVKAAYGRWGSVPEKYKDISVRIGNDFDVKCHALKTRLFDAHGFGSTVATKKFLNWVDEYKPDLIWMHNIHGYYINVELLFRWLKKHPEINKKWTLHDCWSFTGHCSHFTYVECEKWKSKCCNCVQKKEYPKSIFYDSSENNYYRKKNLFMDVDNLELVVPSMWLKNIVKDSFLSSYKCTVVNNKIDLNIFRPIYGDFKKKYNISEFMILGVANIWNDRKGFYDFIELSKMIGDDYIIVLVGVTEKQIKKLPSNIIGITRTFNVEELANIYTEADVFLNLTYEDTYPTVNLEAQACGTECITYKTGGSTESVPERNVVERGDLKGVYSLICNMRKSLNHM